MLIAEHFRKQKPEICAAGLFNLCARHSPSMMPFFLHILASLFLSASLLFSPGLACQHCSHELLRPHELQKRELALVQLLDKELAETTKSHLHWHGPSEILHALRHTVRFRHWADMFDGVGGVGAAFIRGGLASGTALDLSLGGALHDVTSDIGFAAFLIAALELVPFGLAVIGLPCSTFVFLSRGTSKRHRTNRWLGDVSRSDVRAANIIAERVVVICEVLLLRL